LNSETFVLYLRDELNKVPEVDGFPNIVKLDSHSIEVEFPDSQTFNDLIRQLDARNIIVERMRNKENRLEEVFLKMTTKSPKIDLEINAV
jgi:ABC-2 type transport system ATP-binding protein